MTNYILIRESNPNDLPRISNVVRNAYISNVGSIWFSALVNEVTFQAIVLVAAFMFIFMGVPFSYCFSAIPLVPIVSYILIYGAALMKSAELIYNKKPVICWVAEVYEPYFSTQDPRNCYYKFGFDSDGLGPPDLSAFKRSIIGTCAIMKHNIEYDSAWLFRLAVEKKYRKKGVGSALTQKAKDWCKENKINFVELTVSECQEDARHLFTNSGFQVKQYYHKKLCTVAFTIQMFQMRCEVRSTY